MLQHISEITMMGITKANIFAQSHMLQSVDKKLWLVCHVWLIDLLALSRSGCFNLCFSIIDTGFFFVIF